MTRLVLVIGVSTLLFGAPLRALAADAPAAASEGQHAVQKDGGCMPGGGCCGGGAACSKAKAAEDGHVTGGCPCQKAKQAAQQSKPPTAP